MTGNDVKSRRSTMLRQSRRRFSECWYMVQQMISELQSLKMDNEKQLQDRNSKALNNCVQHHYIGCRDPGSIS